MKDLVLRRWRTDDAHTQVGRLHYGQGECFTVEDRWRWNQVRRSCIPWGLYEIVRDTFRGRYPNFSVHNVVGRSAIEFHKGNTHEDTEGCILLCESLLFEPGGVRGLASGAAFDAFMVAMDGIDRARMMVVPMEAGFPLPIMGGD